MSQKIKTSKIQRSLTKITVSCMTYVVPKSLQLYKVWCVGATHLIVRTYKIMAYQSVDTELNTTCELHFDWQL